MSDLRLVGIVISGRGEGRRYLTYLWVQKQMQDKFGFYPFLGTLNLQLDIESVIKKKKLEKTATGICEKEGFCTGLLFKALIDDLECGVVIPQVENYPEDLLEIVASVNLREKLHLSNGDNVEITVSW